MTEIEGIKVRNRVLSYHEEHASAIVKDKFGKLCEFKVKLSLIKMKISIIFLRKNTEEQQLNLR